MGLRKAATLDELGTPAAFGKHFVFLAKPLQSFTTAVVLAHARASSSRVSELLDVGLAYIRVPLARLKECLQRRDSFDPCLFPLLLWHRTPSLADNRDISKCILLTPTLQAS